MREQAFQASGLGSGEEVFVLYTGSAETNAGRETEAAVEYLRSHEIRATACDRKRQGHPGRRILDEIAERHARMVVMGVSKHSTLRDLMQGGATKTVLRNSPVPVFFCD